MLSLLDPSPSPQVATSCRSPLLSRLVMLILTVLCVQQPLAARPWSTRPGELSGDEFVISGTPGYNRAPDLAYNPRSGIALVVWENGQGSYGDAVVTVYGQLELSTGERIGTSFPIGAPEPGDKATSPVVAYNAASDEYLVVWYGRHSEHIYGRRVSATGEPIAGSLSISDVSAHSIGPNVAYNAANGEYLVVWSDLPDGVHAQRISANGVLIGGNFAIYTSGGAPVVAYNTTRNEYLVAWTENRNDNGDANIYGRRVSAQGELPDNEFAISMAVDNQSVRDVAYNMAQDEYLMTWTHGHDGDDYSADSFAQRVAATGAPLGRAIAISTRPGNQYGGAVIYNAANHEYLVVWNDRHDPAGINGQRISTTGLFIGGDFAIDTSGGVSPAVVYNAASGEYLVVWQGPVTSPFGTARSATIYGQRVAFENYKAFLPLVQR